MWKHVREVLGEFRRSIREARRSMASGPSASERRIVATMHRDSIRRELANRSAAAQVHEERQEQAYWQLWRLVRSAGVGAIPPQLFDASIPDHVTLALSVVAEFDEAREEPGSFAESLYRPVSSLPYSPTVIRKCCEFLIGIADSPASSFSGDRDLLVKERDALGLALFSLDYFLDLPASEIPRRKLENMESVKQQYLAGSTAPPKPVEGDLIVRSGVRLTDHVEQVIGVSENDEWMVLTKSGSSMQIVRAGPGKWNEVQTIAPRAASWLDLTPPSGMPSLGSA
jgi:hypothetical protein